MKSLKHLPVLSEAFFFQSTTSMFIFVTSRVCLRKNSTKICKLFLIILVSDIQLNFVLSKLSKSNFPYLEGRQLAPNFCIYNLGKKFFDTLSLEKLIELMCLTYLLYSNELYINRKGIFQTTFPTTKSYHQDLVAAR